MLNIQSKIAFQETETDIKLKLVTILSAIVCEENSLRLQLKTADVLSIVIHEYGMAETRNPR